MLDAPAPLFHLEPMIHVEQSAEHRRGANGEPEWLAHFPVETLLKLSMETSGPQGVLGMPAPQNLRAFQSILPSISSVGIIVVDY